ncbi:MAG: hypothetical protein ACXAD7_16075, partial [Candidatus Kariarchaeaceae archaeon]
MAAIIPHRGNNTLDFLLILSSISFLKFQRTNPYFIQIIANEQKYCYKFTTMDNFMETKEKLVSWIEENNQKIIDMSDKIWDFAETGLQEHKSADYLVAAMKSEGFEVESGVADMSTAFIASYGTEKPVIAILGEYDALPGLSQEPVPYRKPLKEGANGQGCGHNLLGVAGVGAAIALKKEIEAGNLKGTVKYYGCPAEEFYNSKGWMVVNGYFDDV